MEEMVRQDLNRTPLTPSSAFLWPWLMRVTSTFMRYGLLQPDFLTLFLMSEKINLFLSVCRWPMLYFSMWRCCRKGGQIKGKCLPLHQIFVRLSFSISLLFVVFALFVELLEHKRWVSSKACPCGKRISLKQFKNEFAKCLCLVLGAFSLIYCDPISNFNKLN